MALIQCPECQYEISDTAKRCPNCGYKFSKRRGSWIAILLIVTGLIILLSRIGNKNDNNIIEDDKTYSLSWREPYGSELTDIGRIIVKNNVNGCGEYYVKRVSEGEYLIACSGDGENWDYYVVYTIVGTLYRANDEMLRKLKPPR